MNPIFGLILVFNLQFSSNQNLEFWLKQLNNSSIDLRVNALQKIAEIKNPASLPYLQDAISSDEPTVRYYAAIALGRQTFPESAEILSDRLVREEDIYVKGEIRRNMNQLKEYFSKQESKVPPASE